MLSNAGVAFGLNVAAVFLIGAAGGLVLTLAGVFKVCLPNREGTDQSGYLVDHFELFVFWKCNYADTDFWYVLHVGVWLSLGYALALAGLMTYKNASSK